MSEPIQEPKYVLYNPIQLDITGPDGNAFAIMAWVQKFMRKLGASQEEEANYVEESMSGDYKHVLETAKKWISIEFIGEENI